MVYYIFLRIIAILQKNVSHHAFQYSAQVLPMKWFYLFAGSLKNINGIAATDTRKTV